MGAKTFVGAAIATAVIIFLIVVVILQSQDWNELNNKIEAEAHGLEINQSWEDGRKAGGAEAAANMVRVIYNDGVLELPMNENITYRLYSPEGCALQVQAELQASGCEVRCP